MSNFNDNSSLDPILRIIQKNGIRRINTDNINSHNNKIVNQITLEIYRKDIRKKYIENFNDLNMIDRWIEPIDGLNEGLIKYALQKQKEYLIDQEDFNHFIVAVSGNDEKILIELDNRYCKSYQDKINRRAKYLGWKYRKSVSVLLTLTIDPSVYNDDKYLMWIDIKKQLNRFLTKIKYYFKKENRKFPHYVCSIEAQSNGNPHLHILFLGAARLLDWRKIRDIWKLGHIFINRDNSNRKIRNPVNYIMKYISKTYTENNEKNQLTQALCWLFNIRSYQCSRGLITPLKPDKKVLNGLQNIC